MGGIYVKTGTGKTKVGHKEAGKDNRTREQEKHEMDYCRSNTFRCSSNIKKFIMKAYRIKKGKQKDGSWVGWTGNYKSMYVTFVNGLVAYVKK